jgi:hypothetical protein
MEALNDGGEAIYEELDASEIDESFGMGANQSYGGIASTRAEEEVLSNEGFGMSANQSYGEIASTRAEEQVEEEVFSDEGFAMGANQSYGGIASPRGDEEEVSSHEAMSENQGNSGDLTGRHNEINEGRDRIKSSPSKMIYIVIFAILAVSVLSIACSIGFALEILMLKSETASMRQDLEALRGILLSSLPGIPLSPCTTLPLSFPSGYYWVRASNGSAVRVYCDMTRSCGGVTGGWMRVAELDMTNSSHQCPSGLRQRNDASIHTYMCED